MAHNEDKQQTLRLIEPENGKFVVVKSHKLIQARSALNARDQKLLAACIAQINPTADYDGDLTVKLTSNEVCRLTGILPQHVHKFLDGATDRIMNAKFTIRDIDKPEKFEKITIAPYTKYEDKEFTIRFSTEAKSELIQLSRYASYELDQIQELTTKYAIRLYELFSDAYNSRRKGRQRARFSLDDLYLSIGLIDEDGNELVKGYVTKFSKFKSRILLPAIDEINDKTDLSIPADEIGYKRKGRKIAELEFFIRKRGANALEDATLETALLRLDVPEPKIAQWKAQAALAPSVAEEQCSIDDYLQRSLDYMKSAIENGQTIDNQVGFLDYLIKNFIVDAPWWANPYSDAYKSKPIEREFCKQYFMGQFHYISEQDQAHLDKNGIVGSSYINKFSIFKENYETMQGKG